jgi:hypothetical protein
VIVAVVHPSGLRATYDVTAITEVSHAGPGTVELTLRDGDYQHVDLRHARIEAVLAPLGAEAS